MLNLLDDSFGALTGGGFRGLEPATRSNAVPLTSGTHRILQSASRGGGRDFQPDVLPPTATMNAVVRATSDVDLGQQVEMVSPT